MSDIHSLSNRHAALESKIAEEQTRPRPDTEIIQRLKITKLHIKDRMEGISIRPYGSKDYILLKK
jgi:hypothetical protein